MGSDERWQELQKALEDHARTTAEGTWWDEAEIRDAVMEANAKGVEVELAFQCREACRSHVDFIKGMHELIEQVPARKPRVLMIDDEKTFLQLVKMNLERTRRYEVLTENDPEAAIETATKFEPDIFLMDVVMPGKDGIDLLGELHEHSSLKETPVIMLTALASNTETEGITKDGVLYLSKPVEMKTLMHCIDEHLRAHAGRMKCADRDGGGDQ